MKRLVLAAALLAASLSSSLFAETTLTNLAKLQVQGFVMRPGQITWTNGMTFTNAIDAAGGFRDIADRSAVLLTRSGVFTQTVNYTQALTQSGTNPVVKAGDLILVHGPKLTNTLSQLAERAERSRRTDGAPIFISGEVYRPGRLTWTNGLTLSRAIALSGGIKQTADPEKIRVRRAGGTVETWSFGITGGTNVDHALKRGDQVFVPARGRETAPRD